jgi:hypothetical protein
MADASGARPSFLLHACSSSPFEKLLLKLLAQMVILILQATQFNV